MVHSVIGYDTIVINSLITTFDGKGVVLNPKTREVFNLYFSSFHFDALRTSGRHREKTSAVRKDLLELNEADLPKETASSGIILKP